MRMINLALVAAFVAVLALPAVAAEGVAYTEVVEANDWHHPTGRTSAPTAFRLTFDNNARSIQTERHLCWIALTVATASDPEDPALDVRLPVRFVLHRYRS